MEQISIGKPIDTSLIRCCSCGKGYDFKNNIYENNILVCPHCGLKHKIDFKFFNNRIDNLKKVDRLNLTDIDIGCPAIDRPSYLTGERTAINRGNPANASGTITKVEIYAVSGYDLTNCKVATFYRPNPGSYPNKLTTRDYEAIGTVTSGSKQTFTVSLDVQSGDYIGIFYSTGGQLERDIYEMDGVWHVSNNQIPCVNYEFSFGTAWAISLYGYSIPSFEYVGTGTFAYSGTATQSYTRNYLTTASGQLAFSGTAEQVYSKNYLYSGSGELAFSGDAVIIIGLAFVGSGSLAYSGEAVVTYTLNYLCTAVGELIYSGEAIFSYLCNFLFTGSGELTYSGEANYSVGFSCIGSGEFTYSGAAVCEYTIAGVDFEYVGSGSFNYSGVGIYSLGFAYISSGEFVYSGAAICIYERVYYEYVGSGFFVFSGKAIYPPIYNFLYAVLIAIYANESILLICENESVLSIYCNESNLSIYENKSALSIYENKSILSIEE